MNKGQLKSNLELYKTQVVELEQRVDELEEQCKKLRDMNERLEREGVKGGKKFDIGNFVQGSTQGTEGANSENNDLQQH